MYKDVYRDALGTDTFFSLHDLKTHTMSSMGSLGFNPNRRHRSTNLQGTINTMVVRPRVQGQRRTQAPKEVAVILPRRTSPPLTTQRSTPSIEAETAPAVVPPVSSPSQAEETHWVYATVGEHHLRATDDSDDIVYVKDSRVLLLYPMVADPDTGIVSMKVKKVDTCTGQLAMRWVDVYDPNTDARYVSQFAMVP